MKRLSSYFFQGLLFLVPIAVTVYAFFATFRAIDSWLGLSVPGLGFLVLVGSITLVGFFLSAFFAGQLNRFVDKIFGRLPFAKLLYAAVKDLLGAFVGERRRFDQPVLVDVVEGGGVQVVGFVTRTALEDFGLHERVAVYIPQSYSFAGQTLLVSKDRVRPVPAESSEVLAFIVSGGVSLGAPD
jgi:uncharacterized membrane protein